MLFSFILTFLLQGIISFFSFTKKKFSDGVGFMLLALLAFAVGFRAFGYDYFSYLNIYNNVVGGDGYATEWITEIIINAAYQLGFGFSGFLLFYSITTFSLLYMISKLAHIRLIPFLSLYCIFYFGVGPLVTIRSVLASMFFLLGVVLILRKYVWLPVVLFSVAILFHSLSIVAILVVVFVYLVTLIDLGRKFFLFVCFVVSCVIHFVATSPLVVELIRDHFNDGYIQFLASRLAAYHSYVWLDFTSVVHYFKVASIFISVICYCYFFSVIDRRPIPESSNGEEKALTILINVIAFSIVFEAVGFLYFNLVWATRLMEYFIPLFVFLLIRSRRYIHKLPILFLALVSLIDVFLGYMSSLNWVH